MRTEEITVTPQMAKKWLEHNSANRPLVVGRVAIYARDMKTGNWQFNGETISFDTTGSLRDGQHRLRACVAADTPFRTLVNFDVDKDVTLYDRGKPRSTVDSLVMDGFGKNLINASVVAVAKMHFLIQKGERMITDAEAKSFLEKYKTSLERIVTIRGIGRRGDVTKVPIDSAVPLTAAFYAYECGVSIETLTRFFQVVATGFYEGDAELAAIVIRNDILKKVINYRGSYNERVWGVFKIEKAIADFVAGNARKRSYKSVQEQTYSNNPKFKEE